MRSRTLAGFAGGLVVAHGEVEAWRDEVEGFRDESEAFRDEQEAIAGLPGADAAFAYEAARVGSDTHAVLEANYGAVTLAEATADDATDIHTALAADIAAAQTAGRWLQLQDGTYRDSTGVLNITDSVRIKGNGATFSKNHGSNGMVIEPTGVSGGTLTTAAVTGSLTLTNSAATWTTNEHTGKIVYIAGPRIQVRKVVSNTATVLTLDEALGNSAAHRLGPHLYTMIHLVEIEDFTINDTTGTGSANLIIRYAKRCGCGASGPPTAAATASDQLVRRRLHRGRRDR